MRKKAEIADAIENKVVVQQKSWWLYLLACQGERVYAGIALDVNKRFALHASGKGAKFTRANRPLTILGIREFPSRSAALKAEHALKRLKRSEKLNWARQLPTA